MRSKVIQSRSGPKKWSVGVFAGGVTLVIGYKLMDQHITWWLIAIALVVCFTVDGLTGGNSEEKVYIEPE